jgi:hypothetical protein
MSQLLISLDESQREFFLQLLQQLDFVQEVQEVQEVKPLEENTFPDEGEATNYEAENTDEDDDDYDFFYFPDLDDENLPEFTPPKGDPPIEELYQIIRDAEEDY